MYTKNGYPLQQILLQLHHDGLPNDGQDATLMPDVAKEVNH